MKKTNSTPAKFQQPQVPFELMTQKQLRSKIKRITSDLSDLRENVVIENEYLTAIRSLDFKKLDWFASMGKSTRHQVMNVDSYRAGLSYGFTEIKFNQYGWLANAEWTIREMIELRIQDDNALTNRVNIACGKNGRWSFGYWANYGPGAGLSFGPSVHSQSYASRDECLTTGLTELKESLSKKIEHATSHPDPSNYNIKYMHKVIQRIEQELAKMVQLVLF